MSNNRIVVGVNHSAAAEAALRWAISKGAGTGCPVTAVHVFDPDDRADLAMVRDVDAERVESIVVRNAGSVRSSPTPGSMFP